MFENAFAIVSDPGYFPGLWALLNSIHAYHDRELRVFLFGYHLASEHSRILRSHPLGGALTLLNNAKVFEQTPEGVWEAKQQVLDFLLGTVRRVCLLDADLILLSRLDDVFQLAAEGRIVSSQDGKSPLHFGEEYRSYGDSLVGRSVPNFNSGFLCMDIIRHWDLATLWSSASRFAGYSPSQGRCLRLAGHGDQGVLNAIARLLRKDDDLHLFPQEPWCNSQSLEHFAQVRILGKNGSCLQVHNEATGEIQRLLHCSGPKWWTPQGREHFLVLGDTCRCFEHFASLNAMHVRAPESSETAAYGGTTDAGRAFV